MSKTKRGQYPVDVNLLASKLKGVAHVLVQESPNYDEASKELNEYYGAVGVYYPNKAVQPKHFWYKDSRGAEEKYAGERDIRGYDVLQLPAGGWGVYLGWRLERDFQGPA
ncbi:hypothetical protein ACXO7I_07505 [Lactobacillus delbrueckii subsp. bulgaricus]|nr:hypothetical protein [Lactobacillus delbrueckii subsp. bulgaricus]MBT9014387.1 hypothetical protein [Lactobacillus delbrueckii subsp. bulgaricus]MBT9048993.1 hypothetical protein [Lactobacillus delbrueckii subsp. bulgaricus]MBT9058466.1 hypothetical protein [Lactobacillus delbrueckii subsp. bulgaricus]MBT9060262.1 hypothetical protein [Lactobacillus delbrueckii subsp. bulgaricus]